MPGQGLISSRVFPQKLTLLTIEHKHEEHKNQFSSLQPKLPRFAKTEDVKVVLEEAFHPSTNARHRALLQDLEQLGGSSPLQVIQYLERRKVETKSGTPLKWVSLRTLAGSVLGALRQASYYNPAMTNVNLSEDSHYRRYLRVLDRKARAEPLIPPVAMTHQEALAVSALLRRLHPQAALAFELWWLSAARPGDTLLLQHQNVMPAVAMPAHLRPALKIRYVEGKGVSLRGPYTVFTLCPVIFPLHRPSQGYIFPRCCRKEISQLIIQIMKHINSRLEAKSVRRGALQRMAAAGVTDDILLNFSGHLSVQTLHRYLGWGWFRQEALVGGAQAAVQLFLP